MTTISILERAFELSRNGRCRNLDDLRRQLVAERYSNVDQHLAGSTIKKQLRSLMQGQPG